MTTHVYFFVNISVANIANIFPKLTHPKLEARHDIFPFHSPDGITNTCTEPHHCHVCHWVIHDCTAISCLW